MRNAIIAFIFVFFAHQTLAANTESRERSKRTAVCKLELRDADRPFTMAGNRDLSVLGLLKRFMAVGNCTSQNGLPNQSLKTALRELYHSGTDGDKVDVMKTFQEIERLEQRQAEKPLFPQDTSETPAAS